MTQVHFHLLVTHLPIFGSLLGAVVLSYALWTKSNHTKNAAHYVFIISAIGAGIAYLTGEGAEEAVEQIQGISENTIELHEDTAIYALISLIALGLSSATALVLNHLKIAFAKSISVYLLFLALISFGLVAWTGYLGGQIRHTEINTHANQDPPAGESNDK